MGRTIQRKATEIAGGMGKKFLPHTSWAVRLCRRGGISLKKDVNEAAEKTVTTHEAMQSLDVVYNFLIQNSGSQSALTALEEVMSFVDGTAMKGDKRQQDVFVKEEMFDDEEGGKCVMEMDNAEMDHGVVEDDDSTNNPLRDRGANSSDDEVDPLTYLEMGNSPELEEHGVAFNDSSFGKSSGSKDQAKTRTS